MADYGTVNFEGTVYTLTSNAEFDYRSHIGGFRCTNPNNWVSCTATDSEGEEYVVWFEVKDTNADMDSSDFADYDNPYDVEKL